MVKAHISTVTSVSMDGFHDEQNVPFEGFIRLGQRSRSQGLYELSLDNLLVSDALKLLFNPLFHTNLF